MTLPRKREKPRRNEHRIEHVRIKPKAKAPANAVEKRHMARLALLGCLLTGRPPELHHLMIAPGKIRRRDHRWLVPLSPEMHRGPQGVHGLGSEALFERTHSLAPGYLIEQAERLWKESQDAE